jgi:hypothetical protein
LIQDKSARAACGTLAGMSQRPPQIKTRAFLANLAIFSEMGPAELDRVAAATVPLYFEKGNRSCSAATRAPAFTWWSTAR